MRSPEKVFGKRSKMKKINKITSCALKAWNTREGREQFWVISPPQDPLFWFLFSGMLQEPDVFCLDSVRQTWYERKIKARIIPIFSPHATLPSCHLRGFCWSCHPRTPCCPAEADACILHLRGCISGKEVSAQSACNCPSSWVWISDKAGNQGHSHLRLSYASLQTITEAHWLSGLQTDLFLSPAEHLRCGLFQVLLLHLHRVIDVDRVGGALRQVDVIDGAGVCLQLRTQWNMKTNPDNIRSHFPLSVYLSIQLNM